MNPVDYFMGWKIFNLNSKWIAERWGVTINTNSREGLKEMIKARPTWKQSAPWKE